MTQIEIINLRRTPNGYNEVTYKMRFTLPTVFGTGTSPIDGLEKIVSSYSDITTSYNIESIPVIGSVIVATETKSVDGTFSVAAIKSYLENRYSALRTSLDSVALSSYDTMAGLVWNGSVWGAAGAITDLPIPEDDNARLCATATGASGAAVTLSIPAVPGKFHTITHLSITAYSTAARTGSATPIQVTTTNINGSPVFVFATAAAIGTTDRYIMESSVPLKSAVPNTITSIVCPATTGVIWRVTALYNINS